MLLSSSHFFAHSDATLSYKQAARFYQCAWYVERLYLKNMLHLLKGRNWTVLKQYLLHMATDLYVKGLNLKGNTLLFICVDTVYLERLIESWSFLHSCHGVAALSESDAALSWGKCVLWKWLAFFQTVCLNSVWSDNCFPQRTLHSCARIIA